MAVEYKYDKKGRRVRQTVWNTREDTWPQYNAIYEYDYRDRLVEERYLKYNSTTERMDVYRAREYTYDINGNMTKKKILEGDDSIEYTITYSKGAHITDWDNAVSGGGSASSNLVPTYDANGNMTQLPAVTVTSGPSQFDLLQMDFTYDRKNRLSTYQINSGDTRTLKWDALGRIREKTWTVGETSYTQVFYHDGRTLMQIWDETREGVVVSRDIAYDLYVGETGYLKDIDFNSDPDEEGYLVKDAQGSVRAIVNVTYSGGAYTVTTERYNTDGYGAWLDFDDAHSNGAHFMRYISTRVEDYCDSGSTNDNQALYHTDHRHYLPFLGIFLQREPLMVSASQNYISQLSENPAGLNPYRYANNKPTISTDRTGLDCSEYNMFLIRAECALIWLSDVLECLNVKLLLEEKMEQCNNEIKRISLALDARWGRDPLWCYKLWISDQEECVHKFFRWPGLKLRKCLDAAYDFYVGCLAGTPLPLPGLSHQLLAAYQCNVGKIEDNYDNCRSCASEKYCACLVREAPHCVFFADIRNDSFDANCPNCGMICTCTVEACIGCLGRKISSCSPSFRSLMFVPESCSDINLLFYGLPGYCAGITKECYEARPDLFVGLSEPYSIYI